MTPPRHAAPRQTAVSPLRVPMARHALTWHLDTAAATLLVRIGEAAMKRRRTRT